MDRKMIFSGKDFDPIDKKPISTEIEYNVPSDDSTAGMGMPITMRLCRKIVHEYHTEQVEVFDALSQIPSSPEIEKIKDRLKPEKEIVSGIYGRDTLLHILAQPGCEGIRFINCIYEGQKSVVLVGVDANEKPLRGEDAFGTDTHNPNVILYEVKGGSKTRQDIINMIPKNATLEQQKDSIFRALM